MYTKITSYITFQICHFSFLMVIKQSTVPLVISCKLVLYAVQQSTQWFSVVLFSNKNIKFLELHKNCSHKKLVLISKILPILVPFGFRFEPNHSLCYGDGTALGNPERGYQKIFDLRKFLAAHSKPFCSVLYVFKSAAFLHQNFYPLRYYYKAEVLKLLVIWSP